jgi:cytochrome c oxidase subunit 2
VKTGIGTGEARRQTRVPEIHSNSQPQEHVRSIRWTPIILAGCLLASQPVFGNSQDPSQMPNMFKPQSTPAESIFHLSVFVLAITAVIFVVVFSLLTYSVIKFRRRPNDDGLEPPPVYGSNQIELAWTVIPVLIVLVLFLATARVIHGIQQAERPAEAIEVIVIGHQFWWEFRYPALGVVAANELHVPVSDPSHPTPTFITLLSADTDHSFWVPSLAGKTDLIPNHENHMWIDPNGPGIFVGQCAQYCGTQHAKMLLRVYVDSRDQFKQWVQEQSKPAQVSESAKEGRRIFETTACINCHAVSGTVADGRFGPDLTHLMSRDTIASGAATNTFENLRSWIHDPETIKPGSLMPAMNLNQRDLDAVTAYLETLR